MERVIMEVPTLGNKENIENGSLASALVLKGFKKGLVLPKDATNGDIIKAMFPNGKVIERDEATGYEQMIDDKYSYCSWFDGIWWNAPYKGRK